MLHMDIGVLVVLVHYQMWIELIIVMIQQQHQQEVIWIGEQIMLMPQVMLHMDIGAVVGVLPLNHL